eukprot:2360305-Amphidinium_carterae.1
MRTAYFRSTSPCYARIVSLWPGSLLKPSFGFATHLTALQSRSAATSSALCLTIKGGEFESDLFTKMLREQGDMQTNTPSYQPQSNGLAERMVGLMRTSCRRLLFSANMANILWPYAVQLSAQQQQAS